MKNRVLMIITVGIILQSNSAFGQGMETEPNCEEGTTLMDGSCVLDDPLNCDLNDPYDYECGMAEPSRTMDRETEVTLAILSVVILSSIIISSFIVWRKRK